MPFQVPNIRNEKNKKSICFICKVLVPFGKWTNHQSTSKHKQKLKFLDQIKSKELSKKILILKEPESNLQNPSISEEKLKIFKKYLKKDSKVLYKNKRSLIQLVDFRLKKPFILIKIKETGVIIETDLKHLELFPETKINQLCYLPTDLPDDFFDNQVRAEEFIINQKKEFSKKMKKKKEKKTLNFKQAEVSMKANLKILYPGKKKSIKKEIEKFENVYSASDILKKKEHLKLKLELEENMLLTEIQEQNIEIQRCQKLRNVVQIMLNNNLKINKNSIPPKETNYDIDQRKTNEIISSKNYVKKDFLEMTELVDFDWKNKTWPQF